LVHAHTVTQVNNQLERQFLHFGSSQTKGHGGWRSSSTR